MAASESPKTYLPAQRVNRGKAGYRGDPKKIVVLDKKGNEVKGQVKPRPGASDED